MFSVKFLPVRRYNSRVILPVCSVQGVHSWPRIHSPVARPTYPGSRDNNPGRPPPPPSRSRTSRCGRGPLTPEARPLKHNTIHHHQPPVNPPPSNHMSLFGGNSYNVTEGLLIISCVSVRDLSGPAAPRFYYILLYSPSLSLWVSGACCSLEQDQLGRPVTTEQTYNTRFTQSKQSR